MDPKRENLSNKSLNKSQRVSSAKKKRQNSEKCLKSKE